ncbi:hypothetical protein ATANTOWER_023276 [Ataeniobius toweri]|uniref:FAM86 N-terminal domain-containing protein n=1 Tax=Ataeniobius toweri TaxID=208326 RepID=A0ABU7AZA7_9TELE|nr:hypothetical protein [Ataeniobius toweri]
MNRLASFPWTFIETELQSNKSSEFTSELLKQTCLHPLCETFPPSVRFRRLFLTELIKRQEAAGCDPLDELYDALAEVVGVEETPDCYKSYFLPNGDAISLLESIALISEGTTGLVTWEAALYLAEWTLENQQVFTGRSVLELGSGVGLTVLEKLRENVWLNRLGEETSPAIRVDELDWTTVTEEQIRGIRADTVIAADVVYDPDVAGSLVKLLLKILDCSSVEAQPEIYICSTVRNPETYSDFKLQLEAAGLNHEVMTGPVGTVFPYNRLAPLELIKVFR